MSKPSREEASLLVSQVISLHNELNYQWDAMSKLTGCQVDSLFGSSVWSMHDMVIKCVAQLVWDDANVLAWYIWENECGKKKFKHSLPKSKRMKIVKDVESLLDVLGY